MYTQSQYYIYTNCDYDYYIVIIFVSKCEHLILVYVVSCEPSIQLVVCYVRCLCASAGLPASLEVTWTYRATTSIVVPFGVWQQPS